MRKPEYSEKTTDLWQTSEHFFILFPEKYWNIGCYPYARAMSNTKSTNSKSNIAKKECFVLLFQLYHVSIIKRRKHTYRHIFISCFMFWFSHYMVVLPIFYWELLSFILRLYGRCKISNMFYNQIFGTNCSAGQSVQT